MGKAPDCYLNTRQAAALSGTEPPDARELPGEGRRTALPDLLQLHPLSA